MEQTAGPPVPIRIGQYYETPRPHPWRPTLGYESVEVAPLYALIIFNLCNITNSLRLGQVNLLQMQLSIHVTHLMVCLQNH